MIAAPLAAPLLTVVGAGGVGKTTLAAALGVVSAEEGADTLVMTFDPSRRLKDALGVQDVSGDRVVRVALDAPGRLDVSLLDARATFDRLVARYAPNRAAAERIYQNRFYHQLAGHLAGVLEYMAVERLFEVAAAGQYARVVLDTPPTRQALDFLEAPDRIVGFLDSGALRLALRPWFTKDGHLRRGKVRRRVADLLDGIVGLNLLRDMAEFFQAFAPLYDGFRARARAVQRLLRDPKTRFLVVSAPGEARIPDTLFFARRLRQGGHHVAALAVNQVHPLVAGDAGARPAADGVRLLAWLAERDARGLAALRRLVTDGTPVADLPLMPTPPTGLPALAALGRELLQRLDAAPAPAPAPPWSRKARRRRG
ncbi:MAG: ArsA family ATPase [Gemmatimonadota bacterium]|nr:ArsA family ATPase [Gemmatimonadota bacterium]